MDRLLKFGWFRPALVAGTLALGAFWVLVEPVPSEDRQTAWYIVWLAVVPTSALLARQLRLWLIGRRASTRSR